MPLRHGCAPYSRRDASPLVRWVVREESRLVWRGWFVDGLLQPRVRVRPRSKSVDFHDAENRQRSCRTIVWHVKEFLSVFA
ncbi:hypothetical protein TNCV_2888631 [Trichonephila clavipes]|nr:hypothetical protein TNCV_2888631 [Trichonephila clavipes]